jgi:hypothetical protein
LSSPCGRWGLDHQAWSLLVALVWKCFCGIWLWIDYVSKLLVLWSWNYVASATLNLVCNNLFEIRCMWAIASYLWNVVTGNVLCWIMYDLGLLLVGLKSFVISWTTGIIWAQVRKFDRSGDCFCSCALIIWTVPWQLASEQDSTLNMSFVYLKQKFLWKI